MQFCLKIIYFHSIRGILILYIYIYSHIFSQFSFLPSHFPSIDFTLSSSVFSHLSFSLIFSFFLPISTFPFFIYFTLSFSVLIRLLPIFLSSFCFSIPSTSPLSLSLYLSLSLSLSLPLHFLVADCKLFPSFNSFILLTLPAANSNLFTSLPLSLFLLSLIIFYLPTFQLVLRSSLPGNGHHVFYLISLNGRFQPNHTEVSESRDPIYKRDMFRNSFLSIKLKRHKQRKWKKIKRKRDEKKKWKEF